MCVTCISYIGILKQNLYNSKCNISIHLHSTGFDCTATSSSYSSIWANWIELVQLDWSDWIGPIGLVRLDRSDWNGPIGVVRLEWSDWNGLIGMVILEWSNWNGPIWMIQLEWPIGVVQFEWFNLNGPITMVQLQWSNSNGRIAMVQLQWSNCNGPVGMVQFECSNYNNPIGMVQFEWSNRNGPIQWWALSKLRILPFRCTCSIERASARRFSATWALMGYVICGKSAIGCSMDGKSNLCCHFVCVIIRHPVRSVNVTTSSVSRTDTYHRQSNNCCASLIFCPENIYVKQIKLP